MKAATFIHVLLCFVSCMVSGIVLAAEDVILRTEISPRQPWVGQKVLLHVDVLVKDGWAQIKKVRDIEINGAYLLKLETQGTRLSETINGDTYSGQRYELMLFPQREGRISIPAVLVEVEIKSWGADAATRVKRVNTSPFGLQARTPPGAEGIRGLISTTQLTATQTWQPETDDVQIGDAIKRKIVMESADVSGMAFAPMQYRHINGVGIYPGEPTVKDTYDRGELSGKRIETLTYIFEHSGDIDIPAHVLTWWDIDAGVLREIRLDGRAFSVTASSTMEESVTSILPQTTSALVTWAFIFIAIISGFILFYYRDRIRACWTQWRYARNNSEVNYFKHVRRSLRSRNPKVVLRDAMQWLDRVNVDKQPARLDIFLMKFGDARLQEIMLQMARGLDNDDGNIDWRALSNGMIIARKNWLQSKSSKQHSLGLLPDLNSRI